MCSALTNMTYSLMELDLEKEEIELKKIINLYYKLIYKFKKQDIPIDPITYNNLGFIELDLAIHTMHFNNKLGVLLLNKAISNLNKTSEQYYLPAKIGIAYARSQIAIHQKNIHATLEEIRSINSINIKELSNREQSYSYYYITMIFIQLSIIDKQNQEEYLNKAISACNNIKKLDINLQDRKHLIKTLSEIPPQPPVEKTNELINKIKMYFY